MKSQNKDYKIKKRKKVYFRFRPGLELSCSLGKNLGFGLDGALCSEALDFYLSHHEAYVILIHKHTTTNF